MQIAPLPENEVARLKALYEYSILDTEPEDAFDDLTRLASSICGTPIALISLVDAERQWFKSKVGIQVTETPRNVAFCAYTILQPEILVIPDTLADERFADHPLVISEPYVRFYVGAPLITSEGVAIGTLCAVDHKPHQITAEQLESLKILSRQVVRLLEQRRNLTELSQITVKVHEIGEQLRLSQERFELAVQGSNDGLWDWDVRNNNIFFSPRWKSMLGYAEDEISSSFQEWVKRLHPLDAERVLKAMSAYLHRECPSFELEYRLQHKNGTYCWVLCRGMALWDENGKAYRMAGSHTDITARKQAEAELKESEAQLCKRSYQLELALFALKQTQAQVVQSAKMSSLNLLVAGLAHEINNPVSFIKGNIKHAEQYLEGLLELLQLYQTHLPSTPEIQAKAEDIELDFLLQDLPNLLNSIHVGTDRIHEIVQSFRIFSHLDEAEVKFVNVHEGINSTLMILQSRLKGSRERASITVVKDYGDLPQVECHAGLLNQVFMNILANAIDALEEGNLALLDSIRENKPTITICTETLELDWVRIRIRDNGPGITSEVKQQLFDPFFTTKEVGKGTGLGMSISYQIVTEKHGGVLQCLSEPGNGAEFVIDLPVKRESLTCDTPRQTTLSRG